MFLSPPTSPGLGLCYRNELSNMYVGRVLGAVII